MGTLLNDQDLCFWSHISQEVNCLAGITVVVFQLDEKASTIDPYYGETVVTKYRGNGVKCPALFRSPDKTPIAGEEGLRFEKSSSVFFSKKDLDERKLATPKIGDLIQCWGLMYEVTNVNSTGGRFSDTGETAEYEVSLMRKTKDHPESVDIDPQRDLPEGAKS